MPTRFQGPPRETLALDTFIKLMRAANTVVRHFAPPLRERGLTESQLGVLEALLHLGPMTQTQLCDKLLLSGSNLTTVLDNLERQAWVRRERDARDRRVQVVHLTADGRRVIEAVFPEHVARITALMARLTQDEQRELGRLCKKLGLNEAAGR